MVMLLGFITFSAFLDAYRILQSKSAYPAIEKCVLVEILI